MNTDLSDMEAATVRGSIIIAQRSPQLAVSKCVGELVKIIHRLTGARLYCHDDKWCRSLNGAVRCSDCPYGNGQPSIVERIAIDERPPHPPVSETDPPISIGWPSDERKDR